MSLRHRFPESQPIARSRCLYVGCGSNFRPYEASGLLDERSLRAVVHFVVEAAGVAQVVAGAVATPQRRRNGAAVDALAPLHRFVFIGCIRTKKRSDPI